MNDMNRLARLQFFLCRSTGGHRNKIRTSGGSSLQFVYHLPPSFITSALAPGDKRFSGW
jgi:hypothetical protein